VGWGVGVDGGGGGEKGRGGEEARCGRRRRRGRDAGRGRAALLVRGKGSCVIGYSMGGLEGEKDRSRFMVGLHFHVALYGGMTRNPKSKQPDISKIEKWPGWNKEELVR